MKLFSVRRPGQWLWRTGFTRQQILDRWLEGRFEDNLLVCPLGDAHLATTLLNYRTDEQIHERLRERRRLEVEAWKAEVWANIPLLLNIGGALLAAVVPLHVLVMILVIFVDTTFGLSKWPTWIYVALSVAPAIGIAGLIFAVAGFVQWRLRAYLLWRNRDSGQMFL